MPFVLWTTARPNATLVSMINERQLGEMDMAPNDIEQVVRALLDGIERGELSASPEELEFLTSIMQMLSPDTRV